MFVRIIRIDKTPPIRRARGENLRVCSEKLGFGWQDKLFGSKRKTYKISITVITYLEGLGGK